MVTTQAISQATTGSGLPALLIGQYRKPGNENEITRRVREQAGSVLTLVDKKDLDITIEPDDTDRTRFPNGPSWGASGSYVTLGFDASPYRKPGQHILDTLNELRIKEQLEEATGLEVNLIWQGGNDFSCHLDPKGFSAQVNEEFHRLVDYEILVLAATRAFMAAGAFDGA